MKIIKLNTQVLDLDGKPLPGEGYNLGKLLAHQLVQTTEGTAIKHYDWGVQLHRTGIIKVDNTDYKYLLDFVTNCRNVAILGKAQLLIAFQKAEEEEEQEVTRPLNSKATKEAESVK